MGVSECDGVNDSNLLFRGFGAVRLKGEKNRGERAERDDVGGAAAASVLTRRLLHRSYRPQFIKIQPCHVAPWSHRGKKPCLNLRDERDQG